MALRSTSHRRNREFHLPKPKLSPDEVFGTQVGALYRSSDSGGAASRLSSGCSDFTFGPRIAVASNSVTIITPGTGSSIISTMTVSTVETTFFATARFDLALVTRFLGVALALVRFAAFPRTDLAGLRVLPRVAAFPLRAAACFFR